MDDSFIARMGYDPVRIFAHLHGHKPTGIAQLGHRAAETEPPEVAAENPPRPREGGDCLGEVAAAPAADGGVAAEDPTTTDAAHRRSPSPSELGEDLHAETAVRVEGEEDDDLAWQSPDPAACLNDWLVHNWDTIKALEAAGRLPELEAPSPEEEGAGADAAAPDEPPPLPPIHVRKGDRWNRHKMTEFLRQLAATHSVSAAARSVGMSRESAYRLRNRLKGQPFDIAWEAAFRQGYDNLAHAALDRAVNGVEVPHYHNGELIGTSRKFDERLTVALLAMRNRYGAPLMGRYGAAAEWWSERWDAMLQRVETGSIDWRDERAAVGPAELSDDRHVDALIDKHAPEGPSRALRRR